MLVVWAGSDDVAESATAGEVLGLVSRVRGKEFDD